MFENADEVLSYVRDEGVEYVDVRFCDLPGVMQHFTMPANAFDEDAFITGLMFDGSSIRGFQEIHESDMKLKPDPTTAFVDPFRVRKTLALNFAILDPLTDEPYSRDPRNIAAKAEAHLAVHRHRGHGLLRSRSGVLRLRRHPLRDQAERRLLLHRLGRGQWNTGRVEEGGNRGYKTRYKGGYFPVPPVDHYADLRDDMVANLGAVGIEVERAHHEVGTAGQAEINYRFDSLLHAADKLMLYKYVIKNTAWAAGKTATFMPKPLFGDNGSGMHCHQSLWKAGEPLFYDELGYAGLSDTARWYIGGLLAHAPSLLAFTCPTVNSYHRLVPGLRGAGQPRLLPAQPVRLHPDPDHRAECQGEAARVPRPRPVLQPLPCLLGDAHGRPRWHPQQDGARRPHRQGPVRAPPDEHIAVHQVPGSLPAVLDALEEDHAYLLEGDVFTPDLIDTWVLWKRENEIDPIRLRPHPHEFELYYDL